MAYNFISHYLQQTRIVESPNSYLLWSSFIAISSVLRHNVYYDFPARKTKVCPNIYVILVGDSGATRKSTPLKIACELVRKIGKTKLVEGRASIQGIMKELAAVHRIDKHIIKYASALIYSEEFSASIVKDSAVTGILCDIYDYKESHGIILKSEETVKLEKVCINLLSATNAAFLQTMFTKEDIFGGLVGRTFFIIEERARHKDLGLRDDTQDRDWNDAISHLMYLSNLEGKVILEEDAISFLEQWYETTDFTLNESKTGYEHRAHTHVMKLALILAAAEEGFNKVVKKSHCEQAITIVTDMRKNYHKLVATVGVNNTTVLSAANLIVTTLMKDIKGILKRDEILLRLFGQVDLENFDKAIQTLQASNMVAISGDITPCYSLTKIAKEKIMGVLETKGKSVQ